MNCINCEQWEDGLVCVRKCINIKVSKKVRHKLYWRLNKECGWQEALVEGSSLENATLNLLLSIKTIYKVSSNGVEISKDNTILFPEVNNYGI